MPEWDATRNALGGFEDTERFVSRALIRLGAALTPFKGGGYGAPLHLLPDVLQERLQAEGLLDDRPSPKPLRIAFEARPRTGFLSIHRAHPLTGVLAETFLENALDDGARQDDPATLPRCGVWDTDAVDAVTTLLLLRIRHRLHSRGRLGPVFSMAEEAAAIAFADVTRIVAGDEAFFLLEAASRSVIDRVRDARLQAAVAGIPTLRPALDAYAAERAAVLAGDHTRVRHALGSRAAVTVEAVTPVDVIGLYVLLPRL